MLRIVIAVSDTQLQVDSKNLQQVKAQMFRCKIFESLLPQKFD